MVIQYQSSTNPTWLKVIKLLRWDKPAGRLILMIPALWGVFFAAEGTPPIPLVVIIILGTLATSAAGCVINDLWDRDIDPMVERTKSRPLADRSLSLTTGIIIALVALVCAAIMAFYLNPLSWWLSVAAVPVIVGYPSAKRFFPIPQLILSLAWGFAVLISWSAVTGSISSATWLLWGATIFWTLGFDTVYALSDREDDLKIGINSSAIFFGKYASEAIAFCFLATSGLLAALALMTHLNVSFWLGWVLALVLWIWEYVRLRQPDLPRPVYGEIFRENVWIGFILLLGMIFGYIF